MWYEVVPSFAIVFALVAAPPYFCAGVNYLFHNKKTSVRFWENHAQDFHLYLRDRRLTGSEYKPRGLEGIPDEQ